MTSRVLHRNSSKVCRNDSLGGGDHSHHANGHADNFDSLTYVTDESDAWRAMAAKEHYRHRGNFWNEGKHQTMITYLEIAAIGIVQASVAYFTNLLSNYFIKVSEKVSRITGPEHSLYYFFMNVLTLDPFDFFGNININIIYTVQVRRCL